MLCTHMATVGVKGLTFCSLCHFGDDLPSQSLDWRSTAATAFSTNYVANIEKT